MNGEFKKIKNFSNYYISKNCDVINKKGKILKTRISKSGYYELHLRNDCGELKTVRTHRLMKLTWDYFDGCEKLVIDHIDSNKLNNNYENLEWVSSYENIKRAFENNILKINKTMITEDMKKDISENYNPGLNGNCKELMTKHKIGKTSFRKIIKNNKIKINERLDEYSFYKGEKINPYDVPKEIQKEIILKYKEKNKSFLFLEKEYGVGRKTIKKIIEGKYLAKKTVKLSENDVYKIREMINEKRNKKEIADLFNVCYETILNIRKNKTWKI